MNEFKTHSQQYIESKQYLMDELQHIISSVDDYISEHGFIKDAEKMLKEVLRGTSW